jgi:hypothetical protein
MDDFDYGLRCLRALGIVKKEQDATEAVHYDPKPHSTLTPCFNVIYSVLSFTIPYPQVRKT